VIEAVPDELESKLEIFILLDKICRPETILASSTSVLSISEIASVTYRAEKCIGMRFSSGQVELVRGPADEETFTACSALAARIG
jgi:3-hydroxybutyryl-CoA dehydrogenase